MIYFIRAVNSWSIKIGVSSDPKKRLASLQTGSAEPLELLGTIPGDLAEEKRLHSQFARFRIGGEWFRGDDELLIEITRLLRPPIAELARRAQAAFWWIDGIARDESGRELGMGLFCVIRGNQPVFPNPDEMLPAVWTGAKFFLIFEISWRCESDIQVDDETGIRMALTSKDYSTWVATARNPNEFLPVISERLRLPVFPPQCEEFGCLLPT